MTKEALHVDSYNPFGELTFRKRLRQVLHTHQGRDKLFKVCQYWLRLRMWLKNIQIKPLVVTTSNAVERPVSSIVIDDFTTEEKNFMTISNTRRLFRVGRFVGEFVRVRVTLIKCSELILSPSSSLSVALFLQSQMILDIVARLLMCLKSLLDDIAYLSQKGFLHSDIESQLFRWSARLVIPALLIDLYLNTTRLVQGIYDAQAKAEGPGTKPYNRGTPVRTPVKEAPTGTFSLLSNYQEGDKLRKGLGTNSPNPQPTSSLPPRSTSSPRLSIHSRSSLEELVASSPQEHYSSYVENENNPHSNENQKSNSAANNNYLLWSRAPTDDCDLLPSNPPSNSPTIHNSMNTGAQQQDIVIVNSYPKLFWTDFELHWVFITQLKLILDTVVAVSVWQHSWESHYKFEGVVASFGLLSGILQVYRVWTYGR